MVSPDRESVLMLHHRKLDQWFQPGGHADGDNDVLRVALRETSEETGLDATHIRLIDDGTAIGMGLATAVNRLKDSTASSKVVILLTDGKNGIPADHFVRVVRGEPASISTTQLEDSIAGHLIGFGADRAMEEHRVVDLVFR